MECKFFIGQKVVCVMRLYHSRPEAVVLPEVGKTYTVRDIYVSPSTKKVGIRLEEIVNVPLNYLEGTHEAAFEHTFFRPTTDITIFNEILANAPKELEPA